MEENTRQQGKINLITPPDKLYNYHKSFLLVYPSQDIKLQFQNLIENFEETLNVYIYEEKEEPSYNWLIDIAKISTYVILDIDNFNHKHTDIISYLLGFDNVFWLTKGENLVYNTINKNRIYNLDWMYDHIGGKFET